MNPLAAPAAAIDAQGETGDRPRGPRIEHLCRAICSYTGVNPDQVLDYTNGKPSKLAWQRHDLYAARFLRELDALASRSESPEARPNAAGQEQGWMWVPVEPTRAMIEAGATADPERESVWAAYLSAVPKVDGEAVGSSGMTADKEGK